MRPAIRRLALTLVDGEPTIFLRFLVGDPAPSRSNCCRVVKRQAANIGRKRVGLCDQGGWREDKAMTGLNTNLVRRNCNTV